MNVLLFDYGTGNLHSLRKALELCGARVRLGTDPRRADALVLPGVGAFGAAADRIADRAGRIANAARAGLPVLGICLGMQLLLDASEEGDGRGLGLVPGTVRRLRARRVPHMGWNRVLPRTPGDPLFHDAGGAFYFANSYAARPAAGSAVIATVRHEGDSFPAAIRSGSVTGVQFHPEKSGAVGLRLIRNFVETAR